MSFFGTINKIIQPDKKPFVGVYGVTSVGKSTFLNAMLQNNDLKVGMGETTKKIHVIQHEEDEKKSNIFDTKIEKEYLFKDIPILKEISIVDIPGTNQSFSDNDIINVVKNIDVIIWIFDIHSDISERDKYFLKNVILENMIQTVVILNKVDSGLDDIDLSCPDEYNDFMQDARSRRDTIISFFKKTGAEDLISSVFPVSAKKLCLPIDNNYFSNKNNIKRQKFILEWNNQLVKISKDTVKRKFMLKLSYKRIEEKVSKDIEKQKKIAITIYKNKISEKINDIDDKVVLKKHKYFFDYVAIKNNVLAGFVVNYNYKKELINLSSKIREIA